MKNNKDYVSSCFLTIGYSKKKKLNKKTRTVVSSSVVVTIFSPSLKKSEPWGLHITGLWL